MCNLWIKTDLDFGFYLWTHSVWLPLTGGRSASHSFYLHCLKKHEKQNTFKLIYYRRDLF